MIRLCIATTIPEMINAFWNKQLNFLQKNGYEITLVASEPSNDKEKAFVDNLPEGVRYEAVTMTRVIQPWQDLKAFLRLYHIFKKGRFDIVQYTTPKVSLLGSVAAWLARVPVRLYLMWGLYYVTHTGSRKFMFKTFENIVCGCSTAIAPDSKGSCKFAVERGLCKSDKISIVAQGSANGVDVDVFDPEKLKGKGQDIRKQLNIPDNATVFGCVAAIVGDKGINELVEAFADVAKSKPNAFLLYIGQTAEKDPIKDQNLELLSSHDKIINLGWQSEPQNYMAAMDIFVLPTYREGFGVVNIEASAMALPVISTDVPGPRESIVDGQTGLLVPARTVEPLILAMRKLSDDRELAYKLGQAGRQRVLDNYEQKMLWNKILEHRKLLLSRTSPK